MNYQKTQRKKKRKGFQILQALMALLLSLVSLTTGAFGIFPNNALSQTFREVLGDVLPIELILPVNQYFTVLDSPNIPIEMVEEDVEVVSESTLSAQEVAEALLDTLLSTPNPAMPPLSNAEQTITPTASPIPTSTPIPTTTPSPSPTPTENPWWYFWASPTPTPIPNAPPVCYAFTAPNTPQTSGTINLDISSHCSDPDGDPWSLSSAKAGNGAASVNGKSITYDPNSGFAGTDTITYVAQDSLGATQSQKVTLTITNLPPIAVADAGSIAKNAANAISIPVLGNDTDPGGDVLSIASVNSPLAAIVGSSIEYTPAFGFSGTDSFNYTVQDTHNGTDTASINVTVINSPPTCPTNLLTDTDQSTVGSGSAPTNIGYWCSDPNGDTYTITAANSTKGSGTVTHNGSSIIYFDPNDGFAGTDTVTYTVDDGDTGGSASFSYTIQIDNSPPSAVADSMSVRKNSKNNVITVLSNDSDPGNDTLTITAMSTPSNGTATFTANSVTYTPNTNYLGKDSFTYTISDGNGGTATATVSIVVDIPWCSTSTGGTADTKGCEISGIKLNGVAQTSLTVSGPGASFTLEFDYQVWDTICPGCQIQVMPGMESTSAGCVYDNVPGAYPGANGNSGVLNLTAPSSPGSWAIFINPAWQNSCTTGSYMGYGEVIALITVPKLAPTYLTLYNAGSYTGDLGGRANADAICAANIPSAHTRAVAFLSGGGIPAIANIPAFYGIPTNYEVWNRAGSDKIANDWADLMDGSIAMSLQNAYISSFWWSGSTATGASAANDCNNWTSALNTDTGFIGSGVATDSTWISLGPSGCHRTYDLLCIAWD